uniref:ANK_REP_REGION domain-containing protein n=1 Tax=Schistocephalus solidus TaxID=70667 RepID=A0A183SFA4_SCHSO
LLLEAGVNVDITGPDSRTALRAAAWAGHTEIVQRLLEAGANVNQADAEGRTPLIAAAYMGCTQVIEILADAGANLNHADQDGRTALCVAAFCVPPSEAHTEVVANLLQLGADPNLGDRENVTPLIGAAQSGRRRICELCLEADADVDRVDRSGRSALVTAVVNGHVEVVQLLLLWGAAVHTIDANGRSVLSIAAACGHTEVVRELLARGLDEAHQTGDSYSYLPLYATAHIATGLSTLAVRCYALVAPVSSPPPIACSAASACVNRGVPLRLGSPRFSSPLLTPFDATSAGVSL